MPSTVINAKDTQIVRLSHNLSVAEDGLVTLDASFYVPEKARQSARKQFELYAPFAVREGDASLQDILPQLQGPLSVASVATRKQNGIVIYDVSYVSAVAPAVIHASESVEKLNFNSFVDDEVLGSGALSFDYYTLTQTFRSAIVRPATLTLEPRGRIVFAGLNVTRSGNSNAVSYFPQQVISSQQEIVGNVARMQVTAREVYNDTTAQSIIWSAPPLKNSGLSDPWSVAPSLPITTS